MRDKNSLKHRRYNFTKAKESISKSHERDNNKRRGGKDDALTFNCDEKLFM